VVCTGAGYAGRFHWLLELFSHFRLQSTAALLVLMCVPLAARRWRSFAFIAGVFAVHAVSLAPMWLEKPAAGAVEGESIRAVLWNVNTANRRHEDVISFLRRTNADVLLILEIDDRWLADLRRGLPDFEHVAAEPRGDNFGIGLFSKIPFEGGVRPMGLAFLPAVVARFQVGRVSFELIGVHALPPKNLRYAAHRNEMFDRLIELVPPLDGPVVLLGDLTVTPWSPYFSHLLDGTGLLDGRRGFGLRPTWPSRLGPLGIPIDHCLVSPGIGVRSFEVGPDAGSDHRALVVDMMIPERTKGSNNIR